MTQRVVFSMGDPHGIGPEVLLKALQECISTQSLDPVIFGDPEYLQQLCSDLGLSLQLDRLEVIPTGWAAYPPAWGREQRQAGEFAVNSLLNAIAYCRDEGLPLLVTPPIHKHASRLAGFAFPGQTECVASFFPDAEPAMTFFSDRLHVLLITAHIPLSQVPERLTVGEVVRKTRLFYQALRALGISRPKLALCGLNPHASEEGMFGQEEETILAPAVEKLRRELGTEAVSDPFPPDTLFGRALNGEFDGVIALYHDQGLIPLKLVAFDSAVNVTLGLPIIRTSPDHGTAFDIAGQGKADPGSMIAAIRWGVRLASAADR